MKLAKITLLFVLLLIHFSAESQLHSYRIYNHRDGLTMTSLSLVEQDKDGALWIGTSGTGFIFYDGFEFNEAKNGNVSNDHHITDFYLTNTGAKFCSQYKGIFTTSKNGNVKKVFHKNSIGDYHKIVPVKGGDIITGKFEIWFHSKAQDKLLWKKPAKTDEIEVYHTIRLKKHLIILSNNGNFIYSDKDKSLIKLTNWFSKGNKDQLNRVKFGHTHKNHLYLTNEKLEFWIDIQLKDDETPSSYKLVQNNYDLKDEVIVSSALNNVRGCYTFATNKGSIYEVKKTTIKKIPHNLPKSLSAIQHISVDRNGDYWLTSKLLGLIKVSIEPFTKVQFHEVYNDPSIFYMFRAKKGEIILTTSDKTYHGNIYRNTPFQSIDVHFTSATYFNNRLFLGSYNGLYEFDESTSSFKLNNLGVNAFNETINMLFADNNNLWVGIAGKGLYRYNTKTKAIKHFEPKKKKIGNYIYTAQKSYDDKFIYFGSNAGIMRYNRSNSKFEFIEIKELGTYCGNSIKDVHGTNWFTLEKGIVGFTRRNEMVTISDPELFTSVLFFTINSDNFGNILLGTNKGINVLTVNEEGKVLSQKNYSGSTGFGGYETHMRSQFQDDNVIFVGTVEGLYSINPQVLKNVGIPFAPKIEEIELIGEGESKSFKFKVFNPKVNFVKYSYRIPEIDESWSTASELNQVSFNELIGGSYHFEVRATYDGHIYGKTAVHTFHIDTPFYKSKKFLILVLISIIAFNLIVLIRIRHLDKANIFYSEDTLIINNLAPSIILFGLIANTASHLLAPFISFNFEPHNVLTLVTACVLLVIYLLSLSNKFSKNQIGVRRNLMLTFIIILGFNIYGCYISNLHPFYTLAIVIVSSVGPFIFDRFKHALIFVLFYILVNGFVIVSLNDTFYSKSLFTIAVVVSGLLVVLMTYVRFDSINKLTFISGVINKGNIPALAFNKSGRITYASENINQFIPVDSNELMDKPISYLNQFVPENQEQHDVDLTKHFIDGKSFVVPMLNEFQELNWIEWSCKLFGTDTKVILGQDITEKIELENTYELLVQNAEDLIYQVDINGLFKFVNDRFYDRLGYEKGDLIGANSLLLVPENYRSKIFEFYTNHFTERKKISYLEFPIQKKNGEIVWLGQYVTSLYLPGSHDIITGFLALGRDITEKREQQEIIANQSNDITSSINYAKRIQFNLLSSKEEMDNSFSQSFVYFKPRDIVSGDFYWVDQIDSKTVLAVGDCTGHGVPGAFMSLLGVNLLNTIVHEKQELDPGRMLDDLDKRLRKILPRESEGNIVTDGMEIAICVFDHKTNSLSYACAGARFLIHDGISFNLFKGDNKHIGDEKPDGFENYITHHTNLSDAFTAYLFTDGFQDQFGGRKNKKYSFRRMLELFEENIRLPLDEQYKMIDEEFTKWMEDESQTDDVAIVGIRGLVNFDSDE